MPQKLQKFCPLCTYKNFHHLDKKKFQSYAIAHNVAFYVYIVEVGSPLLWKFGLGSYTSFCGLLALRAAIDG